MWSNVRKAIHIKFYKNDDVEACNDRLKNCKHFVYFSVVKESEKSTMEIQSSRNSKQRLASIIVCKQKEQVLKWNTRYAWRMSGKKQTVFIIF